MYFWCSALRTAQIFVMPCGQYGYVVDMSLATGFALLEAGRTGVRYVYHLCILEKMRSKIAACSGICAGRIYGSARIWCGQQPPEDKKEYGRNRQL